MDIHALLWLIAVLMITSLLTVAVKELTAWRASKNAVNHPAVARLADIGIDMANMGLAFLAKNPSATVPQAVAWTVQELKASAPAIVDEAGKDASDEALTYMMKRKMMTAAQAAPLAAASAAVIDALAPSAATARVSPAQVGAVMATAAAAAPLAIEDVQAALLKAFPGLAALTTPVSIAVAEPAVPTATAAAP